MKKRILTINELESFCETHNFTRFSAKESGYQLSVHVPATFETDESDDTMLYCNVKLLHTGKNRNSSSLTEEAAKKLVKKGFAYVPILANFTDDENGDPEFTSHDFYLDDNGEIVYLEHQVGCFTNKKPYMEEDPNVENRSYIFAQCVLPREYSKAAEIIERKGTNKISAELGVNEMKYDSNEKVLLLEDVVLYGATLLGVNPDTKEVIEEGMEGAKVSIEDFSRENNSVVSHFDKDEALINILEKLNNTLSKFEKQEVNKKLKLNKLLEKYNKTVEELDFDYSSMTDEELEAKFAELFDGEETPDLVDPTPADPATTELEGEEEEEPMGNGDGEGGGDDGDNEDEIPAPVLESQTTDTITVTAIEGQEYSIDNGENWQDSGEFTNLESNTEYSIITRIKAGEDTDPSEPSIALVVRTNVAADDVPDDDQAKKKQNNAIKPEKYSVTMNNGVIKEFALSLNDKISSLTTLVNEQYSEADDTYYSVIVYDKEVVMVDYWYGNAYKQSFKERTGVFSLTGDRVPVKPVYLTADEEAELDKIKSNYAAVTEELNGYHKAEETTKKETLMSSDEYKSIFETEDYKAIDIEKFSVDELSKHLDEILLKQVKEGHFSYASMESEEKKTISSKKLFGDMGKKVSKKGRYGNLFKK